MNEGVAEGLREGQVRVGTASFRQVNLAGWNGVAMMISLLLLAAFAVAALLLHLPGEAGLSR